MANTFRKGDVVLSWLFQPSNEILCIVIAEEGKWNKHNARAKGLFGGEYDLADGKVVGHIDNYDENT